MKNMTLPRSRNDAGFSLLELIIAMVIMLIAMGIISSVLYRSMSIRARESSTADALTAAQAALAVMSREISNSGFGMYEDANSRIPYNGIVLSDSNANRIRIRANLDNAGGLPGAPAGSTLVINSPGEDVSYFFDSATSSIVRYDPNGKGTDIPVTSVVVNGISNVTFSYYDYAGTSSEATGPSSTPTKDTGRIRIKVEVDLPQVHGQPNPQKIEFTSDVTVRNNSYMLQQY